MMNRSVVSACLFVTTIVSGAHAGDKEFTYIDLQPKANQKLEEGFHGARKSSANDLAYLPQGEQKFAGVKFKTDEACIQLGSTELPKFPKKVEGIKVNKTFAILHILHATAFSFRAEANSEFQKSDKVIARYTIIYDDGTKEVIPVVYAKDVCDWWFHPEKFDRGVTRGKVAWVGTNKLLKDSKRYEGFKVRLYLTTWKNPKPDKKVVAIDYSVGKWPTAPFCVAMTAEGK